MNNRSPVPLLNFSGMLSKAFQKVPKGEPFINSRDVTQELYELVFVNVILMKLVQSIYIFLMTFYQRGAVITAQWWTQTYSKHSVGGLGFGQSFPIRDLSLFVLINGFCSHLSWDRAHLSLSLWVSLSIGLSLSLFLFPLLWNHHPWSCHSKTSLARREQWRIEFSSRTVR